MEYEEMKREFIRGWRTWNVRSVLSHVHMPDGLAVNLAFKEYRNGNYLKETLIGRFMDGSPQAGAEEALPGPHTYDETYTEMTVRWCGMEIQVESTVEDGELLLLVIPVTLQEKGAMLVAETGYLWGRDGYTRREGNHIEAVDPANTRMIRITGTPMDDRNIPVQGAYLSTELSGPAAVYTGRERTLESVQAVMKKARAAALVRGAECGELAEMYRAMECALAWDTIYDPNHNRVISPVSRLWSLGSGGYVLFCWDNFFTGFMAGLGCRELAYSNLIEILSEHTEDGFVPNFSYATGQKSADRSQPPVGSAMLAEVYRRYREKWIVEKMYPDLFRWNTWFAENRMNESGALCWGSNPIPVLYGNYWETHGVHKRFGAALESGLDNSPMYDDIPFDEERNRLKLEDVGLTGLYILDCRSLIWLAKVIGREEDIPELKRRLEKAESGLEGLWDEENGFYYNRRTDTGEFSRRISPTNFYALFSSSVSSARAHRMADEHYYNPEEFYGDWMLPSAARNDPAFPEQNYWRGRVWGPMNFLVYLALKNTDLADVQADLAKKSLAMFRPEWEAHRHVHENYSAVTGEGCDVKNSDRFYHWGALLASVALAEAGYAGDFGKEL